MSSGVLALELFGLAVAREMAQFLIGDGGWVFGPCTSHCALLSPWFVPLFWSSQVCASADRGSCRAGFGSHVDDKQRQRVQMKHTACGDAEVLQHILIL